MEVHIKSKHDETIRNTKANTIILKLKHTHLCKHIIDNPQALQELDKKDQIPYEPI